MIGPAFNWKRLSPSENTAPRNHRRDQDDVFCPSAAVYRQTEELTAWAGCPRNKCMTSNRQLTSSSCSCPPARTISDPVGSLTRGRARKYLKYALHTFPTRQGRRHVHQIQRRYEFLDKLGGFRVRIPTIDVEVRVKR